MTGRDVLRRAIGGHKGRLTAASVLAAAHQGCEALVPVLIGVVVDQAIAPGSTAELVTWLIVLLALFAALSNTYRHALRLAERAAEYTGHRIRLELSERILHPRGGAEAGHLPGALVNIATEDARRVGSVNGVLPFGIAAATGIVVSAVFLLLVSVPLGLLVLLGIPPLLWLGHLIGKPLERRSGVEQERAAHASGVAADLVTGLRVLKGIGAEPAAIDRYRRTSQDSLGATLRAARAQAWHSGAVLTLTGIFIALVALVGGNLAISGSISIGDLVAAVGLAQYLLGPLSVLGWANAELAQGRASAARVAEVLAAPQTVVGGTGAVPAEVAGEIRLAGVRHGALQGVDLEIAPGELVGVVTGDPAAATSLLDCLGRDVDPAEGAVLLDGTPLSSMDPYEVRAAILVAAHDADLFEGSLLENVGSEEALPAAAADEVASALPDGVHTAITERGHSLSGGQRQRVALARALAVEAPVLVVHDPTTAVDTVTEARIASGLARFRRARTTVLVTTSPALLAETDRVALIEDGTVSAVGRHVDLVRDLPAYRAAVLS
ncbi:ABC transporter ATP-binding protein [Amycolatopsis sp. YIM 10]|uniref:ABC transporter ATP-binding protein n=1 Tax=Amycolatopsis sp. YIM 10 TaxID=2653857 RepID=UPI0012A77F01|nr:ABC transporter ATP-binding protein [Amycolatopsis sp. YIM 10]QFU93178.1 Putative multidrug export ATP-binding/permease protein [Amycolatopsis sp. YIM 10]